MAEMEWGQVTATLTRLRQQFEPWRKKVLDWDKMVYPPPLGGKVRPGDNVHSEYLTNKIKTATDSYINRMQRGIPIIEIGTPSDDDAELRKKSSLELFVLGMLKYLDMKVATQGNGTGWLRQVYASAANPGKIIGRVQVKQNGEIDFPILDPYNCYHDLSGQHKVFAWDYLEDVHQLEAGLKALDIERVEYSGLAILQSVAKGEEPAKRVLKITQVWTEYDGEVWTHFLVNGTPLARRLSAFKRLPFIVVSMNTMPRTYQDLQYGSEGTSEKGSAMMERHAEPWFATLERAVVQYNETMSLYLDALNFVVNPVLLIQQLATNNTFTMTNKRLKPGDRVYVPPETVLSVLRGIGEQIPQIEGLLAQHSQEFENAFPSALRGLIPSESASGYLYDQVTDQSKNAIVEYVSGPAMFLMLGMTEVLGQFKEASKLHGTSIKLDAVYPRGERQGQYWQRDFKGTDFPKSWAMTITMQPAIPENEARAVNMAVQIKGSDLPYSDFSILSDILKVQDPQAEYDRWHAEQLARMPERISIDALEAFELKIEELRELAHQDRMAGNLKDAEYKERQLAVAEVRYGILERKLLGAPTPPAALDSGEENLLSGETGFFPENLPSEESTRNSDERASAEGRPNAYMGGRPAVAGNKRAKRNGKTP